MTESTWSNRAERAKVRLEYLVGCQPEYHHQRLDAWLEIATPGEVRRNWRKVARGRPIPGWAKR